MFGGNCGFKWKFYQLHVNNFLVLSLSREAVQSSVS